MTTAPLNIPPIGRRYELRERIGTGGMGIVYRAYDRLTGQQVALKQVVTEPRPRTEWGDSTDTHVALAQEFRTLSSLRHPNIVSVLDYGFNEQRQPYFTMQLLRYPQTILQAGRDQPQTVKIDLLVQLCQALVYLHRRGIIHRDLKPANVLVVNGQVKVLDFGLSLIGHLETEVISSTTAGTLAYMAPEMFQDQSPSLSSDLYAVGVLAYELLGNVHPFHNENMTQMLIDILHTPVNVRRLPVGPELQRVLEKLLAKTAEARYGEAQRVLRDLCAAADHPLPPETHEIREGYLQAAPFCGRTQEFSQWRNWLEQARDGHGSAHLIGGESGVGKSRLVDELRTLALVQGVTVLRGQTVQAGGTPYQLWLDILRWLALTPGLADTDASLLQPILPDIHTLLGRPVAEPPFAPPQEAQKRLFQMVTVLLQGQEVPLLLILEDLHWAGENSLALLNHLSQAVTGGRCLILATYRTDETPALPDLLPDMHPFILDRLDETGIMALTAGMLGITTVRPDLMRRLQRETEGNPFFLVEIVRALADEAGRLDDIAAMPLPGHIFTGGLQAIVQRRLERLTPGDQALLEIAAIGGRQLDLAVLRYLAPQTDQDGWLNRCANAAALEVQDNQWRFVHDKLREGLLATLTGPQQRGYHRQMAQAIEAVNPYPLTVAARLAYHWGEAGEQGKAIEFATLAGEQALLVGANHEAKQLLEQAVAGLQTLPPRPENQMQLIDTIFMLSRAAVFLPTPNMPSLLQHGLELAEQLRDEVRQAQMLSCLGSYHYLQGETALAFRYLGRSMGLAEKLGLEELLMLPYNLFGRVSCVVGKYGDAAAMLGKGIPLAEKYQDWELLAGSQAFYGLALWMRGDAMQGQQQLDQAVELARQIKLPSRIAANLMVAGYTYALAGQLEPAITRLTECLAIATPRHDLHPMYIAHASLGYLHFYFGERTEAWSHLEECMRLAAATGEGGTRLPLYLGFRAFWLEASLRQRTWIEVIQEGEGLIAAAQSSQQLLGQAYLEQVIGRVVAAAARPDWVKAESHLRRSLELFRFGEGRVHEATARLHLAEIYARQGKSETALQLIRQCRAEFTRLEMPGFLTQAMVLQKAIETGTPL